MTSAFWVYYHKPEWWNSTRIINAYYYYVHLVIACVLFNYKIHNLSRGSNTYFTRYQNNFLIYGCIYFIKYLSRNRMCKIRFIRLVLYPNRHLYDLENEPCIIKQSKRVNYYRLLLNRPRVFLNYSRSN